MIFDVFKRLNFGSYWLLYHTNNWVCTIFFYWFLNVSMEQIQILCKFQNLWMFYPKKIFETFWKRKYTSFWKAIIMIANFPKTKILGHCFQSNWLKLFSKCTQKNRQLLLPYWETTHSWRFQILGGCVGCWVSFSGWLGEGWWVEVDNC